MKISFRPLGKRVVIMPDRVEEVVKGGRIIIPEKTREMMKPDTGCVIGVGEEVSLVRVGDSVLFHRYAALELTLDKASTEPEVVTVLDEKDIVGVIEECDEPRVAA